MNIKNQNLINKIKALGYDVNIFHFRICQLHNGKIVSRRIGAKLGRDGIKQIIPNGGQTVVEITENDREVVARGLARCNPIDNFARKEGTGKALEYAIFDLITKIKKR